MNEQTGPTRREVLGNAAAVPFVANAAPVGADDTPAPKGGLPQVKPEEIGLDPKQLKVAYDIMEKWTTGKDAPVKRSDAGNVSVQPRPDCAGLPVPFVSVKTSAVGTASSIDAPPKAFVNVACRTFSV